MIETLIGLAPYGEYLVHVEDIELHEFNRKATLLMSFVVMEGKYDQVVFTHTETVKGGYSIDSFNQYLEKLGSNKHIEFESFDQYKQLLKEIKEEINDTPYVIEYKKHPYIERLDVIEIIEKIKVN